MVGGVAADRDRSVARYLRREVAAHSELHRRRLASALGERGVRSGADLARVPATGLADAGDPAALVLRPDWDSIARSGDRRFAARVALANVAGPAQRARQLVEHRYKPVHWTVDAGVPVGWSAADLDRLAALGARWLALAGVGAGDVVANVLPPARDVAWWELTVGARRAGVSTVHLAPLPPAAEVSRLRPTVLAGRPLDLARVLESAREQGRRLDAVRTLLPVGEPLEAGLRARLAGLLDAPGAAVVSAWAPPGVRAVWSECRGGTELHTWPEAEVLHVVDPLSGTAVPAGADGEVVWTALGWRGTVLVRVRTGVFAAIDEGRCPHCGGSGPRLAVTPTTPAFLAALDRNPGVAGWQAELREVGGREELLVFLVPAPATRLASLLRELDAALSATQYVVLDARDLDARLAAHGDRRVVDLRA